LEIDIVIPWADKPIEKVHEVNHTFGTNLLRRTRDNGELKFLLRSLDNLPWIRRVFIIVSERLPSWLNRSSVTMVTHSELFPNAWPLPTYNSYAIEAHAHKINALSETFLLLNDDFLFLKQVPMAFFYPQPNTIRVCTSSKLLGLDLDSKWDNSASFAHRNANSILGSSSLPRNRFWHHSKPLLKSVCAEVYSTFSEEFRRMSLTPYRERETDVSIYELVYHLLNEQKLESAGTIEFFNSDELGEMKCRMVNLQDSYLTFESDLKRSLSFDPAFLCVNDDMSDQGNPQVINLYNQVMQKLFPYPSRYEYL
jgi:hypothetical protein